MKSERLLTNKYIEDLNEENDFFRSLDKVNFIKTFIINYSKHLKKDNMLVLYGEWGSGKSTVIKAAYSGVSGRQFRRHPDIKPVTYGHLIDSIFINIILNQ